MIQQEIIQIQKELELLKKKLSLIPQESEALIAVLPKIRQQIEKSCLYVS